MGRHPEAEGTASLIRHTGWSGLRAPEPEGSTFAFIRNWFEELKAKVPVR